MAVAHSGPVGVGVAEAVHPPGATEQPVALVVRGGHDLAERSQSAGSFAVEDGVPIGVDVAGGVEEQVTLARGAGGHPHGGGHGYGPGVGTGVAERRHRAVGVEQPKAPASGVRGDPSDRAEAGGGRGQPPGLAVGDHAPGAVGDPPAVMDRAGGEAHRLAHGHQVLRIAADARARSRSHHDAADISHAGQRHRHRHGARPVNWEVAGP